VNQLRTGLVKKGEKLAVHGVTSDKVIKGEPEYDLNTPDKIASIKLLLVYYGNITIFIVDLKKLSLSTYVKNYQTILFPYLEYTEYFILFRK
jgi:hypothetical protein